MTKRKDSGVEHPTTSRESTKTKRRSKELEVPRARRVVVEGMAFPFRLKGDPRTFGIETDDDELFEDYAREQWMGTVVKTGMYLFDKYIMPDFAFRVVEVQPDNSVIVPDTNIELESKGHSTTIAGRPFTLDDVVGHLSVKKKCKLILKYLEDPTRFGEWAPRAVLFYGPPGTGKTMMATALAREADARILLAKASDLIGMHVGDGGRRISALFEDARKHSPSIIFIDELDAIGLTRSFQSVRGDVSEVVTALLGELDRTEDESGVVVIGATNAVQMIDLAIRSRFDTVFEFTLPNRDERRCILQMYATRLPLPFEADIETIVSQTEGFSGRDLRDRILKEALHDAITDDQTVIGEDIVMKILKRIKTDKSPSYTV